MLEPTRSKTRNEIRTKGNAIFRKVSSRDIGLTVQCLLWGRAAGRCEFAGHNKPLWKSSVTQETVNIAEKAHIYAFSTEGPRGNRGIAKHQVNSLENLLLVCHECHRKIDRERNGGRYSIALLQRMKSDHEQRIERATGIAPDRKSHIVLYGANIGDHSSPLTYSEAAEALFPDRYPAADAAFQLETINSSFVDRDTEFWTTEAENLRRKYTQRIGERIALGDVKHLSVFGLAPQPLLVLFGTLLGDIVPAEVYQRHREPLPSWRWPARATAPKFTVQLPTRSDGRPAVVIALSGTVTSDRITSVLGNDANIWTLTVPGPHNDLIKSRQQLSELRRVLRNLLDRIKAVHGQSTVLHVFPAASVSASIELGRVRMPKADMPWQVYDQINDRGGFVPALAIGYGD